HKNTEATTTRPTTTRPTEPPAKRYTIQAGDTLYTIVVAQYAEYNLSDEQIDEMVKEIIRANPDVITGENGENYSAGDEIKLPAPKFN
ncbi:MAG: LysM domain-containing protein, partial [Eubacteriales bacterium]|nr:LysM domain-containing protein [Eubacteriales bacterium]